MQREVSKNSATITFNQSVTTLKTRFRAKILLRVRLFLHNIRLYRPLSHFAPDMELMRELQTPNVDVNTRDRAKHESWRFVREVLRVTSGVCARDACTTLHASHGS